MLVELTKKKCKRAKNKLKNMKCFMVDSYDNFTWNEVETIMI